MSQNGSSDSEKAYAINEILNNELLNKIDSGKDIKVDYYCSKRIGRDNYYSSISKDKLEHIYNFTVLFKGEFRTTRYTSFSAMHSMLANLVLDYPKVENEHKIVTNLRENYNKILKFSKDNNASILRINNCNIKFQKKYANMLRHILVSNGNLPKNIDINSIKLDSDKKLTYIIEKK